MPSRTTRLLSLLQHTPFPPARPPLVPKASEVGNVFKAWWWSLGGGAKMRRWSLYPALASVALAAGSLISCLICATRKNAISHPPKRQLS